MTKPTIRSTAAFLKVICSCGGINGASGLYYVEFNKRWATERSGRVWVCGKCLMPKQINFEQYLERCDHCLDEFSSPWEEICEKCFNILHSDIALIEGRVVRTPHSDRPTYRSWAWGAQKEREGRERARWHHIEKRAAQALEKLEESN